MVTKEELSKIKPDKENPNLCSKECGFFVWNLFSPKIPACNYFHVQLGAPGQTENIRRLALCKAIIDQEVQRGKLTDDLL